MLTLFKFLQKHDYEYIVYYDDLLRPYGDKPTKLVQAVIADAIQVLRDRWCDQIILPPTRELVFRDEKDVLPLFQTYMTKYCLTNSLVGKIGLIGDWSDIQIVQPILETFTQAYTLTSNQQNTKKFHTPFARRSKEVPLRKYFLTTLSYSDPMVNKVLKFDLRYFKDAQVDTLIPLNYGYFNYQTQISKLFNYKKCRFHKLEKLEKSFTDIVDLSKKTTNYSVQILYTGQKELLQRQKKTMRTLQRGKEVEVVFEKI